MEESVRLLCQKGHVLGNRRGGGVSCLLFGMSEMSEVDKFIWTHDQQHAPSASTLVLRQEKGRRKKEGNVKL